MKKALLLTDGSIDTALLLNRWMESQSEPIDLTVVYPFTPTPANNQSLKSADYAEARQTAREQLNRWLDFLPQSWSGQLHTELLAGEPNLVMTIYLLLRRYDYLLLEGWNEDALSTYQTLTCQRQINTQTCWLSPQEESCLLVANR